MKKRILSLVLCAAMLLSMAVLMGAGNAADTTESASALQAVNFTNVAPFGPAVTGVSPLRARSVTTLGLDDSTTGSDNGLVTSKTATDNGNGKYTITLEAYTTGTVTTETKDVPTDIVLVLDQSGSMADCIVCGKKIDRNSTHTVYTYTAAYNPNTQYNYYIIVDGGYIQLSYDDDDGSGWWSGDDSYTGWYYTSGSWMNPTKHEVSPKTSESDSDPSHVQFYTRTGTEEACTSRLSALKKALNTFTEAVKTKAAGADGMLGTGDDVNHRIAMVGFASDERGNTRYQNTELLTTSSVVNYKKAKPTDYKSALVSVLDRDGNLDSRISNAVNDLAASGGTAIDLGTEMANNVLEQHKNETGRNKVVIIFTDGVPGIKTDDSNGKRDEYANRAIANTLKAKRSATEASNLGYGATVYTVGVFDGANASTPGQLSDATGWGDNGRANRFMHLLSSNYPVAEKMNVTGDVKSDLNGKSYYLSAGDSKSLNSIFEQISNQISSPSISLGSETVVKDVVSPYFDMPANTSDIKVYTQAATAANGTTWADRVQSSLTPTISGSSISVTGFDFNANFVSDNAKSDGTYGKKLIIEFTVTPKAGFLGGNGVQTNVGEADGIYASDAEAPVEEFLPQRVDVAVKPVTPDAKDTSIYLGETTNLADRVKIDDSQLDRVNNKYVDVTYTITDENDATVGTYTVPAGNVGSDGSWTWESDSTVSPKQTTTYKVTCTVSPTQPGKYQSVSEESEFTITVNTCSLTIKKTVNGKGADAGQTFVFNVKDSGGNVVTTVVLKDGDSKKITGLPVGSYTVTEDTNWSWSYKAENDSQTVTLGRANTETNIRPTAMVSVVNTFSQKNWLTSLAEVINQWKTNDDGTAGITQNVIWPKN